MTVIPISQLSSNTPDGSAVFPFSQKNNENLNVTYKVTLTELCSIIQNGIKANVLNLTHSISELSTATSANAPDSLVAYSIYDEAKKKLDLNGNNTLLSTNGANDFTQGNILVSTLSSEDFSPVNVQYLRKRLEGIDSTYTAFPDYDNYESMTDIPLIKKIDKIKQQKSGAQWNSIPGTLTTLTSIIYVPTWNVSNYTSKPDESYEDKKSKTRTKVTVRYTVKSQTLSSSNFTYAQNNQYWDFTVNKNCWIRYVHTDWLNENVESQLQVSTSNGWFNLAKSLSYATNPKHGITGDSGLLPFNAGTTIRMFGRYALYFIPMVKNG